MYSDSGDPTRIDPFAHQFDQVAPTEPLATRERPSTDALPPIPTLIAREKFMKSPLLDLSDLLPQGMTPQQFLADQARRGISASQPTAPNEASVQPIPEIPQPTGWSPQNRAEPTAPVSSPASASVFDPTSFAMPQAPLPETQTTASAEKKDHASLQIPDTSIRFLNEAILSGKSPKTHITVGVELSKNSAKWVALLPKKNGFELVGCGVEEYPVESAFEAEARFNSALLILQRIRSDLRHPTVFKFVADDFIAGTHKSVELPALSGTDLKAALEFSAKENLAFPEENLQLRTLPTGKPGTAQLWHLYGFDQAQTATRLQDLRSSSGPIHALFPQVAMRLELLKSYSDASSSVAILDCGFERTCLIATREGVPVTNRELPFSGRDCTLALVKRRGLTGNIPIDALLEAEAIKRNIGFPEQAAISHPETGRIAAETVIALRPLIESLTTDTQRALAFHAGKEDVAQISKLYFVGGGALLRRLPEEFSLRLGIPVESWSFGSNIDTFGVDTRMLKTVESRLAIAAQAATTNWDHPLNMIDAREVNTLRLQRREPVLTAVAAAVLLIVAIVQLFSELSLAGSEKEQRVLLEQISSLEPSHQEYMSLKSKLAGLSALNTSRAHDFSTRFVENSSPVDFVAQVANRAPWSLRLTYIHSGLPVVVQREPEPSGLTRQRQLINTIVTGKDAPKLDSTLTSGASRIMQIKGIVAENPLFAEATVLNYVLTLEQTGLFTYVRVVDLTPATDKSAYPKFELQVGLP